MIDERLLVDDFDAVAARLATKGVDRSELLAARSAVVARREVQRQVEELRAESNRLAKEVAELRRSGVTSASPIDNARLVKDRLADLEATLRVAESESRDLLLRIPNLPSPAAPIGSSEDENRVLGYTNFEEEKYVKQTTSHWDIGERLGIYDPERSARMSGSMFALLRGDGARLLRALVNFALDLHRDKYEEVIPPHVVTTETFTATGHLPKFADDAYRLKDEDLWLIPTGEVPLMSMHRSEILEERDLPVRYMAYTSCFRREAGSAGKDTRGMQRLHEFHKVELVKLCTRENVEREFEDLLADARKALDLLELPYRLVDLCTADLTFSSERIIDLEVWAPGTQRWLEVSSVGVFGDFQTRRGNIRYRPEDGGKPQLVQALNGSALATPRVWAAILEHGYDRERNLVRLPDALVPYFGSHELLGQQRLRMERERDASHSVGRPLGGR